MHTDFKDIETPALLIEKSVLEQNVSDMQAHLDEQEVGLRPHIKTHKSVMIAQMQIDAGATGIACAKSSEAEIFADAGFKDIQIPNIIIGREKIERLLKISESIDRLTCCIDSFESARALSDVFDEAGREVDILMLVDCGYGRCGLSEFEAILKLAQIAGALPGLNFKGITTHAGHAYSSESPEQTKEIGMAEGQFMADLGERLRKEGINIEEIVPGSNPTAKYCSTVEGVTGIRSGNYIFNDMIQVALGTVPLERCALSVLATVISTPTTDRAILDSGSKTMSSDKGGHGNENVIGHGFILDKETHLSKLSEEHGIVLHDEDIVFSIGEKIRIVPNHACTTVNNFDFAYIVDGDEIVDVIEISARGCIY